MRNLIMLSLAAALAAAPVAGQDLRQIGSRLCTVEGTDLHSFVSSQLPGCDHYCLVDKSVLPEYQDYPGEVFSCVDRRDLAAAQPEEDEGGLGVAALGGLVGLGLLLGAGGGGGRPGSATDGRTGSTNNTQ